MTEPEPDRRRSERHDEVDAEQQKLNIVEQAIKLNSTKQYNSYRLALTSAAVASFIAFLTMAVFFTQESQRNNRLCEQSQTTQRVLKDVIMQLERLPTTDPQVNAILKNGRLQLESNVIEC